MTTKLTLLAALCGLLTLSLHAQMPSPPPVTLFQNVRVFDSKSDKLTAPMNVLVRGNVEPAGPPEGEVISL